MHDNQPARPVVKIPGGKRYLLPKLVEILEAFPCPDFFYDEPMVGGGAVYFAFAHRFRAARIADLNPELTNLYRVIRGRVEELIAELRNGSYLYAHKSDPQTLANYHRIRASSPTGAVERAARYKYLVSCCFNGIHRTNKSGQFNTPPGSYTNPTICDEAALRATGAALADTTIAGPEDAATHIRSISSGSKTWLFVDPPYHGGKGKFTSYCGVFGDGEQRQLVEALLGSGCPFIYTNRATELVLSLFDGSGTTLDQVELRHSVQPKYTTGLVERELVAYRL